MITTKEKRKGPRTRAIRLKERGHQFFCSKGHDLLSVYLNNKGIKPTKRGYPLFVVHNNDGSIYGFIDVQHNEYQEPTERKKEFIEFLSKQGVPFVSWLAGDNTEQLDKFLMGRY